MKTVLNEYKAEQLLKKNLPVAKNKLIKKKEELKKIKLKFPLVLKIISDKALHKTNIRGIKIVQDKNNLEESYDKLIKIAKQKKLKIYGILAQEFQEGLEIIIGIKKDPVFNHVIVFGLGGIFTEILKVVSIRKCPITINDADEMINEISSKEILFGYRNRKYNLSLLKKILVIVSKLPKKYPNISELDINPLIINAKNAMVVDARIIMK